MPRRYSNSSANTSKRRLRSIAEQNLLRKLFRIEYLSVKLSSLSVAIAVTLALLLAPLSRAIADQRCDMLGRSDSEAKNCQGCCAQMKCCPVSKQEEKAQSTQPISGNRPDSGFGNILAIASADCLLLYSLACNSEEYRLPEASSSAPIALSLARLCIRLI
jgi:hypothetical protein